MVPPPCLLGPARVMLAPTCRPSWLTPPLPGEESIPGMPFYELTAWPVQALSLVLLAVALVTAVVVLPRHRNPGLAKYLIQAVSIVLVSLLTLLTLFLKLNAENQWYSSWADLFAGGPTGPVLTTVVGSPLHKAGQPAPLARGRFSTLQRSPASNRAFGA